MNQSLTSIVVHLAESLPSSTAEQIEAALAMVNQMGLVTRRVTFQSAQPAPTASVHLLIIDPDLAEQYRTQLAERFAEFQGEVLTLAWQPLGESARALPARCQERVLDLSRLTPSHQPIRVALDVLQLLDAAHAGAEDGQSGPKTSLLPQSLVIRCQEREHRLPADYGGLFTIGRGPSCQLQVDSTYASRLHGCFRVLEGAFTYRDMSSNGTRLLEGHDERIVHDEEVPLANVGALRIGGIDIRYERSVQ